MKEKIPRIVFFTNIISPYINDLFNNLNSTTNLDFEVLACAYTEPDRQWKTDFLKNAKYKYSILPDISLFQIPGQNRFVYVGGFDLFKMIIRKDFDVIIFKGGTRFVGPITAILARIFNIKTILWEQNSDATTNTLFKRIIKSLYVNNKLFNAFIAYGNHVKSHLINLNSNNNNIYLAYSPVDNDKYRARYLLLKNRKNFIKKSLKIAPDEKIILYAGRFVEEKNISSLIRALDYLRKSSKMKLRCFIIGGGKLKDELQYEIDNLELSSIISIISFIEFKKLTMFYSIADVFVLPSNFEPWGLVVNEAMNFNLPVIVSDKVGCANDLVKDNYNGFVYENGNIDILSQRIIQVLDNSEEMGKNSYNIIKNVNFDQVCRRIVDAVDGIHK